MSENPQQEAPRPTLRSELATLVDERGRWQQEALKALNPETWATWFAARLDGRDPYFPYDREEFPAGAADLFRQLFRENKDLDTEAAAEGLARYLESLDPATQAGVKLRQAMDLVMRLRARLVMRVRTRETSARSELRRILRGWIEQRVILEGREALDDPEEPTPLHRVAMFALIALQKQDDESDRDVWEAWLDDERFAEVAFSGLAVSVRSLPEGKLKAFLDLVDRAERKIFIRPSLEALFVGRDRTTVINYLWDEVQGREQPEQDWDRLRKRLDRVADLSSFRMMNIRRRSPGLHRPSASAVQKTRSWIWDEDFSFIQRAPMRPEEGVLALAE